MAKVILCGVWNPYTTCFDQAQPSLLLLSGVVARALLQDTHLAEKQIGAWCSSRREGMEGRF